MAFVPVPNTIQVEALFLLDGQRIENTLYFERTGGWNVTQISEWLEQVQTIIQEELLPLLSSSIQFIELVARLLDAASSIGFSLPINPPINGGLGVESMPNNVSYTVSFKTGLTGRSFRGRNYISGLGVDSVASNTIAAATRTGLLEYFDVLLAAANANATPWVVVSRYSGIDPDTGKPIPRVTGVTTPVTSVTTYDLTVDSQRRRLPGRGS